MIGSGSRGIAACRVLSERDIHFDCFEKLDSVAGSLFGGPEATPGPQTCAIAEALEAYVDRFGFRNRIVFGCAVEYVWRRRGGCWRVHLERGPARLYDAIVVAVGAKFPVSAGSRNDLLVPGDFPFLDPGERQALGDDLPLWKHLIHPRYPSLFFLAQLPAVRLTMCVAEEQSRFVAASLARDYALPARSQMERERQAMRMGGPAQNADPAVDPAGDPAACPASVADSRYAFHLRWLRAGSSQLAEAAPDLAAAAAAAPTAGGAGGGAAGGKRVLRLAARAGRAMARS